MFVLKISKHTGHTHNMCMCTYTRAHSQTPLAQMVISQSFWPKTGEMRALSGPSAVTLTEHDGFHGSARVWWRRRAAAPSLHGVRTGDRKFLRDRQWRRRLFRSVVDPVRAMGTRAANAALHSLRSQRRSLPSLSWSRGVHATSAGTMSSLRCVPFCAPSETFGASSSVLQLHWRAI